MQARRLTRGLSGTKLRWLAVLFVIPACGQIALSPGVLPATPPTVRYNDQFLSTGNSTFGDSGETAWGSDGTVYTTFGDTTGFNTGCSNNLTIGKFTDVAPHLTGANINCMTAFGGKSSGSGYCASVGSWKPGGILQISDGLTAAGLYMWIECVQTSTPFAYSKPSLLYSADNGVTWCAPGHTGGACSTAGDVPSAPLFAGNLAIVRFVQYEKGASGTLVVDDNNTYIYAIGMSSSSGVPYNEILMRATRGSNLQTAASWQFFTGTLGSSISTPGSWASSTSGATVLMSGDDGTIRWIPGYGYLKTDVFDAMADLEFYTAPTLTGPWTGVFFETVINPPIYGFPALDLSSLSVVGRTATGYVGFEGSASLQTGNPITNQYSQFWRQLTISAPTPVALSGTVSISGAASVQ